MSGCQRLRENDDGRKGCAYKVKMKSLCGDKCTENVLHLDCIDVNTILAVPCGTMVLPDGQGSVVGEHWWIPLTWLKEDKTKARTLRATPLEI